jgi:hypothetical protein
LFILVVGDSDICLQHVCREKNDYFAAVAAGWRDCCGLCNSVMLQNPQWLKVA